MHERPIGDLVNALLQAGAQIECLENAGFPPLRISPATLDLSQPLQIRGDVSSQFLTALLMALPLTKQQATIEVVGELISKPYIEITLNNCSARRLATLHYPSQHQISEPWSVFCGG
jgi:3-phosphoshikimate 1-carboxyvinyltransferase